MEKLEKNKHRERKQSDREDKKEKSKEHLSLRKNIYDNMKKKLSKLSKNNIKQKNIHSVNPNNYSNESFEFMENKARTQPRRGGSIGSNYNHASNLSFLSKLNFNI
jgi:hypothetical protein